MLDSGEILKSPVNIYCICLFVCLFICLFVVVVDDDDDDDDVEIVFRQN